MAMLAEPRKKQKISSNPRGNVWSQDDSKFGQRMLEKMGWSEGKGLGAKEDGKRDHLSITHKADNKGVGCSASYADNWIAQQDDFNSILAGLNENHGQGGDNSPDTVSGLEEKSRSSKKRVHYQKFTKGKDLSLRKREDMDCIFGRRKMKPEQSSPSAGTKELSDDDANEKPVETDPQSALFTTSTSSLQDYFATKMAAIKGEQTNKSDPSTSSNAMESNQSEHEEINQSEEGTKRKKKHKKSTDIGIENDEINGDIKKKRKKKKRKMDKLSDDDPDCKQCSNADINSLESLELDNAGVDADKFSRTKTKKEKRKKDKDTIRDSEEFEAVIGELDKSDQIANVEEIVERKKKKSCKREKIARENGSTGTDNRLDAIVNDSIKESETEVTKTSAANNRQVLFQGIDMKMIPGYGKKL